MIGTSSTALMAVSASTTEQWLVAVSGLSFLGLLGVASFFAVIQPSGSYPSPFGDQVQIERFFSESRPQVQALGAVQALVALSFLVFAASSTGVLQADAGEDASYFWVALAGGVVAGAFILLTAILVWALSRPAIAESPPVVRALHDLAYLAGGPAHALAVAVFLGASSLSSPPTSSRSGSLGLALEVRQYQPRQSWRWCGTRQHGSCRSRGCCSQLGF